MIHDEASQRLLGARSAVKGFPGGRCHIIPRISEDVQIVPRSAGRAEVEEESDQLLMTLGSSRYTSSPPLVCCLEIST